MMVVWHTAKVLFEFFLDYDYLISMDTEFEFILTLNCLGNTRE